MSCQQRHLDYEMWISRSGLFSMLVIRNFAVCRGRNNLPTYCTGRRSRKTGPSLWHVARFHAQIWYAVPANRVFIASTNCDVYYIAQCPFKTSSTSRLPIAAENQSCSCRDDLPVGYHKRIQPQTARLLDFRNQFPISSENTH